MTKFQQTGPVRWWVESWAWWSEGVILTSCHCHISVLRSADLWSEEQQAGLMWGGGVSYLVNNAEATKESKFKEKKKVYNEFYNCLNAFSWKSPTAIKIPVSPWNLQSSVSAAEKRWQLVGLPLDSTSYTTALAPHIFCPQLRLVRSSVLLSQSPHLWPLAQVVGPTRRTTALVPEDAILRKPTGGHQLPVTKSRDLNRCRLSGNQMS